MTKEELKQEAEENYHNHKIMDFQGFYNHHYYYLGYVESAEPREKRIADLEEKLANADYQLEGRDIEIAELKEKLNFSTQYYQGEKAKEQLTKAKDFILKLTTYLEGHTNYDFEYELIKEVKQFLKDSEVEK